MVKLRIVGDSYIIAVPKIKVKKKGFKAGQLFDWEEDSRGNLVLVPVKE